MEAWEQRGRGMTRHRGYDAAAVRLGRVGTSRQNGRRSIAVVDPPSWSYTLIPVAEYGHWPSAVPAATLERLGRHDGGRVLRVVVREHPPRVYGFGPDPDVEAFT